MLNKFTQSHFVCNVPYLRHKEGLAVCWAVVPCTVYIWNVSLSYCMISSYKKKIMNLSWCIQLWLKIIHHIPLLRHDLSSIWSWPTIYTRWSTHSLNGLLLVYNRLKNHKNLSRAALTALLLCWCISTTKRRRKCNFLQQTVTSQGPPITVVLAESLTQVGH
jgi:hypothetical protein